MKRTVLFGILILLIVSIVYQGYYMIRFMVITEHIIPDEISVLYIAWQDSYDTFVAVPNIILFPLLLYGFYYVYHKLIELKQVKQKG